MTIPWQKGVIIIPLVQGGKEYPTSIGAEMWVLPPVQYVDPVARDPITLKPMPVSEDDLFFPSNLVAPTGQMVYFWQKMLELKPVFKDRVQMKSIVEFLIELPEHP